MADLDIDELDENMLVARNSRTERWASEWEKYIQQTYYIPGSTAQLMRALAIKRQQENWQEAPDHRLVGLYRVVFGSQDSMEHHSYKHKTKTKSTHTDCRRATVPEVYAYYKNRQRLQSETEILPAVREPSLKHRPKCSSDCLTLPPIKRATSKDWFRVSILLDETKKSRHDLKAALSGSYSTLKHQRGYGWRVVRRILFLSLFTKQLCQRKVGFSVVL